MPRKPTRKQRPPTRIVESVTPEPHGPARVARRFRALLEDGVELRPVGRARKRPALLLQRYVPRAEVRLFDATYWLTDYRFDDALGFFVAYVHLRGDRRIHPRIFYKDSSLVWRVASHYVHDHREYWIGKGDVRCEIDAEGEHLSSAEETTNLPYEIQAALNGVSRMKKRRRDDDAVELVLRKGPPGRIEPYSDFRAPRRKAADTYRIHGGRPVARFMRRGDPTSLRFARGFEPDFDGGVLDEAVSVSRFFGGDLRTFRILSTNRQVQYLFMASPTHAWVNPPQALTTELSTYGVRVHDVEAAEDLCVPGYEYHELDGNGEPDSQIPAGYAGDPHPDDPCRADASRWLEALPVIREFRSRVLRRRRARARRRSLA